MTEQEEFEEQVRLLTEKVEKLDRIVYRQWRDLKALVNDRSHRNDTKHA